MSATPKKRESYRHCYQRHVTGEAHDPEVGSSNLPPATMYLKLTSENLVKTLWSLRGLSPNTQRS